MTPRSILWTFINWHEYEHLDYLFVFSFKWIYPVKLKLSMWYGCLQAPYLVDMFFTNVSRQECYDSTNVKTNYKYIRIKRWNNLLVTAKYTKQPFRIHINNMDTVFFFNKFYLLKTFILLSTKDLYTNHEFRRESRKCGFQL